jgi:8-oxo-dGTP diphosphatase
VLTRNTRENALRTLDLIGLAGYFEKDDVLGRDESCPKPDPSGIHHLALRWDADPAAMVMVGDYLYDLQAGRAAGAMTVHVDTTRGFRWPDLADIGVGTLAELALCLRKDALDAEAMKPHLHVACAIIEHEGRVLVAQRSETMSLPLKWEFPGGKLEQGETPEQCLARELREELALEIRIGQALPPAMHSYEAFRVTLYPFVCSLAGGVMRLHEHRAVAWVEPGCMAGLDWAAADLPVIAAYLARQPVASHGAFAL